MRTWIVLGTLVAASVAHANGRAPATSDIHFRPQSSVEGETVPDQDVLAGLTFGLVVSHDRGATWHWFCENAVGYGGLYDPDYEWTAKGGILATTFDGLKLNRDGCTFEATNLGHIFVSRVARGSDSTLYAAAADPTDSSLYASTDDGTTFVRYSSPGAPGTWWQSLEVAPSKPTRIYLSGYNVITRDPNRVQLGSDSPDYNDGKQLLLYRSDDGGHTFSKLSTQAFRPYSQASTLDIAAISPADPDLVFVRITGERNGVGDGIYRSDDAGGTWTHVLDTPDSLQAFVARRDGSILTATQFTKSMFRSLDGGKTFEQLPTDLLFSCFTEDPHGRLWACTQNYVVGFGIGASDDLAHWSKVLHYAEIAGPVACAAGTVQHDKCELQNWCPLGQQFGIPSSLCPSASETPPNGPPPPMHGAGCCEAGGGPGGALAGLLVVLVALRRRRD
jgi:uncharacterized protein (TIGR03382 family)